jgi:hypothetical protein
MGFIGRSLLIVSANMVGNITAVVTEYEERLQGLQCAPFFTRATNGEVGWCSEQGIFQ